MANLLDRGEHDTTHPSGTRLKHYPEGVIFHTYHAFECAMRGLFRALEPHTTFPYSHVDKVNDNLDRLQQVDTDLAVKGRSLVPDLRRDDSLYVGLQRGKFVKPSQRFAHSAASTLRSEVEAYIEQIAEFARNRAKND